MAQSRQNTKESVESSKSRNGGLNDHMNNNSSVYNQQVLLQNPDNAIGSPYKMVKGISKKKQNFIENLSDL
tara:strand:+ start:1564 stop:1776 length:213 start_codon:yes stop_codon:yes gene_type:complete